MDETFGAVIISPQVLTTVVRQVAESTTGVACLSTSLSGRMSRMLRGRHVSGGVEVQIEDGAVEIDVYVVVLPATPLVPLGQTLQHGIHRAISDVVGMPVRAVNVHFVDVQNPFDAPVG
jgi:uncharacterized alkaline shock family protein YloU